MPPPPFIYSTELKTHFDVYGFFYDIGSKRYRSCLEIVNKNIIKDSAGLQKNKPDAIVVMMNPGSSRSYHKETLPHKVKSFNEADELLLRGDYILAHPDPTQYQVERLMLNFGWKHVRVLNLSDIREPKSNLFQKQIQQKDNPHSIFYKERRNTLLNLFTTKTVICGWGMQTELDPLIELANEFLKMKKGNVYGVRIENTAYFSHPSPMLKKKKLEWLEKLVDQLK
jgi:hypothetical protein